MKLGLYFICKDETDCLEKMLESTTGIFDEIVAGYTSKNHPETEKILNKYGCKIVPIDWTNNFAKARNTAMKACTSELNMWLDTDDILTFNGITKQEFRDKTIKAFTDNASLGCVWLEYKYDFDKYGNCILTHERERIMRKGWFEWKGSLHENCIALFGVLNQREDKVYVKHNTNPKRIQDSAKRNLEIAQSTYDQEKKDGTLEYLTVYDLARSISVLAVIKVEGKVMRGIEASLPYFSEALEIAKDDNNRAEILMKLAEIMRRFGKIAEAQELDSKVIKLKPKWPDGFIGLGESYFQLNRYDDALACYVNSLNLDIPIEILAQDPTKYKVKVYEKIAWCLFYLEQGEKSLLYINKVLESNPHDSEMLSLQAIITDVLEKQQMTDKILAIKKELDKEKNPDKIKNLALALPDYMKDEAFAIRMKNEFCPTNVNNRVIIYCGESTHPWSPNSVRKGIGGSEEAVIYISKELAKLGWNVDVYCICDAEGNYDGVMWKSLWSYTDNEKCDVFVAWRNPEFLRIAPKTGKKYMWLHDVKLDKDWDPSLNDKVDKVFFLTNYHRGLLKSLPEDKVFITGNGIIPDQFKQFDDVEKVKNRCVYISSPERGLEFLLKSWTDIKKNVPDATLAIYYGFDVWDICYGNDEKMRKKKETMLKAIADMKDLGVTYVGKVGHMELAEALARASYWLYPCIYPEISCISAMKAQASGCYPITSGYAALAETCKYGLAVFKKEDWVKEVTKMLNSKTDLKFTDEMKKRARKEFSWVNVAKGWSELWKK